MASAAAQVSSRWILGLGGICACCVSLLALVHQSLARWSNAFAPGPLQHVLHGFDQPSTQLVLAACLVAQYGVFGLLVITSGDRWRWHAANPRLWLGAFVIIGFLRYCVEYDAATENGQPVIFLFCVTLGAIARCWIGSGVSTTDVFHRTLVLVCSVIIALAVVAVWQNDNSFQFRYRGTVRWRGPFDNPNAFGLLNAAGVLLALSAALSCWPVAGRQDQRHPADRLALVGLGGASLLFFIAAGVMFLALLCSLSRGAWVAAVCGTFYLLRQLAYVRGSERGNRGGRWISNCFRTALHPPVTRATKAALAAMVLVTATLGVSHIRGAADQSVLVERALSSANINDFSWRNRVAGWIGALQIAGDHPWFGLGWSNVRPVYQRLYAPASIRDGAAIQTNDILYINAALGIPAFAAAASYFLLRLRGVNRRWRSEGGGSLPLAGADDSTLESLTILTTFVRTAALVLLVGFWFDGGMFRLETACVFWVLLEIGAVKPVP